MIEPLENRALLNTDWSVYLGWRSAGLLQTAQLRSTQSLVPRHTMAGVSVRLEQLNKNRTAGVTLEAVTGSDGVAHFENIRDGNYQLVTPSFAYPYLDGTSKIIPLTFPNPLPESSLDIGGISTSPVADRHLLFRRDVRDDNVFRGIVFFDSNRDTESQQLDRDTGFTASDGGVPGIRVYLDANNNGRREKKETASLTDYFGDFRLAGFPFALASSPIRVAIPQDYSFTTAASAIGTFDNDWSTKFGIYKYVPQATIKVQISSNDFDGLHPRDDFEAYLDLNRNGIWEDAEPKRKTGVNPGLPDGTAAFKVSPGKYRLRLIDRNNVEIDRSYVDLKVGDGQTRSRGFLLTGKNDFAVGFFFDADKDGARDANEPLLTHYRGTNVQISNIGSGLAWPANFGPGTVDSQGYLRWTNIPGKLSLHYQEYELPWPYLLGPFSWFDNSIFLNSPKTDIPIEFVPDNWYSLYPELAPFAVP